MSENNTTRRAWGGKGQRKGLRTSLTRRARKRESRYRRLRRFQSVKRDMSAALGRVLEMTGEGQWQKLRTRIEDCAQFLTVHRCTGCGYASRWGGYRECGVKVCPFAQKKRSENQHRKIQLLMGAMKEPRFLTLTVKHAAEDPLRETLAKLKGAWAKLRRRRAFGSRVRGGVSTLEIQWHETNGWHPHLHVIYDGEFIDQTELAALWLDVTGDSFIVDVRAVDSKAVSEVSKYLAKPDTFLYQRERVGGEYVVVRDDQGKPVPLPVPTQTALIYEFLTATKGLRTMSTFGDLHGQLADLEAEAEALAEPQVCPSCEAIDTLEPEQMPVAAALALFDQQEALELRIRGPPGSRAA